ncbi:MAG: hypothetical protein GF355_07800, partial [Candidatus Eisenbacteria bacterium]|nr:hypothetical protein [Candidatus Eisenbacteria bacterium]
MAFHPDPDPALSAIPDEFVFSPLAPELRHCRGPLFPLHVGDTWMEPFAGGRLEDLSAAEIRDLHRYSAPRGRAEVL